MSIGEILANNRRQWQSQMAIKQQNRLNRL